MNKRSLFLVLLTVCSALLLSGCWDRTEINDIAFVLASAVDKEGDKVRISVLIPLPGNMGASGGGGGGNGQKSFAIKTETGSTIREGIIKLQNELPRRLYFGHRRVFIIGEELAKEKGVGWIVDSITRLPENRLTSFITISKGKALDILNAQTTLERFSAESMRELLQSNATVRVSLKDVTSKVSITGSDAFLPYLTKVNSKLPNQEQNDVGIMGFALTHNGKMVGIAKGDAANGIRLLSGRFRPYNEMLKDESGVISVLINKANVRIEPIANNNKLRFRIDANVEVSISEDTHIERNYDDIGQRLAIEEMVEKKLSASLKEAIAHMQRYNSDAIGFGQYADRAYPSLWKKEWSKKWDTVFSECEFEVVAGANIYRLGMNRENLTKKAD